MFDNMFPKEKKSLIDSAHHSYDGLPDSSVPMRLLQHVDAPCWQAHAYLRFINQPYWTENILFDVALGVDTPVLVDRQFVMSAQPATRCMEEVAALNAAECNSSFEHYNAVVRLQGLWNLLEAGRERDADAVDRSMSLLGVNSLSKMYSNIKQHFMLTSSTPAYLSAEDLSKSVESCYKLISEQWLNPSLAPVSPVRTHTAISPVAVAAESTTSSSASVYLSGCASPGLADSLLFAHLVEVATSKHDRRGLVRIQHEYPNLFKFFINICKQYFHAHRGATHSELKKQGNSALYQCVLASHGAASQDAISAVAESVFVKLVFGEEEDVPASPHKAIKRPLGQRGRHLVPHLNEACRVNSFQLLRSNYSFEMPDILKKLFGMSCEEGTARGGKQVVENYVGIRCLLFSGFVVASFAKSAMNISRNS